MTELARKTSVSEETVGRIWIDGGGKIWRQISFSDEPTAGFIPVEQPLQRPTVAGTRSEFANGLTLLVPEGESD